MRIALPHSGATLACAVALLLGTPRPALAQGGAGAGDFPVRVIDRPPVLPRGAARLDLGALLVTQPGAPDAATVILGGGVGVLPHLELGGQLVPVRVHPGAPRYASPSLYLSYARVTGPWTIAPLAQVVLPLVTADPFTLDAGLTLTYGVPRFGNLTVAPTLSVNTRQNAQGTSLSVPFTWMHQAGTHLNLQLATGVGLSRFDPRFGLSRRSDALEFDDTTVPLGATVSWTVARADAAGARRPLVDLGVQWQWPQLWSHAPGTRGFTTRDWSVQLATSWYALP